MNCNEFEDIVYDLAHGREGKLDAGSAHVEECARCAARLEDERRLSSLLKALAAADLAVVTETGSAASAIESRLVMAFRQKPVRKIRRRQVHWEAAAAALFLVAMGTLGFIYYRTMHLKYAEPESGRTRATESKKNGERIAALPEERQPGIWDKQVRKTRSRSPHSPRQARRTPIMIRDELTLYGDDTEVATDFIPLTYGESLKPIEKGELIRVRMPRTALLQFGLPMNVERAGIPVKADLLVGEDGLAHAIRFVR
ncbi:MAG: hypothetical protein J2P41_15000 [Blastocatellia bacterium]|nr:hypothetical protein [Blastocatellia bacterium]